ncbi:ribonuclease E activity regulator RraA (plasmid) [Mycolicibacterium psychrotolerans]|uniref:ribonuclease E activity regulator RraA n=1 Tax=Mycolicibacterium psychrotolerans TaxID=216929 RepID=UPI003D677542
MTNQTSTSTADLFDGFPEDAQSCDLSLQQLGGQRAFSGLIATVRCHEDNSILRAMLAEPGEGRVLVVDGGGSRQCALIGAKLAELAQSNGWAGLLINGCVRDVVELRRCEVGVTALGSSPRRPRKLGAGERDVPVSFGGVTFRPGHEVHSDEDGVAVLDPAARG